MKSQSAETAVLRRGPGQARARVMSEGPEGLPCR